MALLGVLGITLKVLPRNGKVVMSITLVSLLTSCLFLFGNQLAIIPFTNDILQKSFSIQAKDPTSSDLNTLLSGMQKDTQILLCEQAILLFAYFLVTTLLILAITYTSAASYSKKQLTFKALFDKIKTTWKSPLITSLYIGLFVAGYAAIIVAFISFPLLTLKGYIVLNALSSLIALFLSLLYIYFVMVWRLGLVVSILEDGYCGMKALGKAEDVIRGRKMEGYVLVLLINLVSLPISVVFALKMLNMKQTKMTSLLAMQLVLAIISAIEMIVISAVFTVFYFECKKSHGEFSEVQMEEKYHLISTPSHVDDSLP